MFVRVHDTLYQRSNGLIGHRIPGAPNSLLLHTVGAKTGLPRTNTLSYAHDGDDYLVVASNGGGARRPAGTTTSRHAPRSRSTSAPHGSAATASTVLPDDPDYARLWRIVNDNNANRYDGYQARTTRPIAIVRLRR